VELIVDIPINPRRMHDLYIDNIIGLMVDIPGTNHVACGQAAALLAINTTPRPNHPEEPIPHKSIDARDKLIAEAGPTKTKIILGWDFNFRRLLISLPKKQVHCLDDQHQKTTRRRVDHRQGTQVND
jgi:hypothetical protein